MLESFIKNNKDKIIQMAMDMFLKKDDKSLIAYLDEKGKPKAMVFKFDVLKKFSELEKKNLKLQNENYMLKKQISNE